jgi:hypothetical protein
MFHRLSNNPGPYYLILVIFSKKAQPIERVKRKKLERTITGKLLGLYYFLGDGGRPAANLTRC